MSYNQINTMIYEALERLAPITTAKVSMFPTDDKYGHPPFLRFRFKDIPKNNEIYFKIKNTLENFKGKLKWGLYDKLGTENYILIPSFFEELNLSSSFYEKETYFSLLGPNLYYEKVNEALEDIPTLAELLKKCYNYAE